MLFVSSLPHLATCLFVAAADIKMDALGVVHLVLMVGVSSHWWFVVVGPLPLSLRCMLAVGRTLSAPREAEPQSVGHRLGKVLH
jgi:hypothetical protein